MLDRQTPMEDQESTGAETDVPLPTQAGQADSTRVPIPDVDGERPYSLSESLGTVAAVAAVFLIILFLAGSLGGDYWLAELTSHFRVQQFVCLLAVISVLTFCRFFKIAIVCLIFLGWMGWPLGQSFIGPPMAIPGAQRIKILSANVLFSNDQYDRFKELIRESDPDVILILEFTDAWARNLADVSRDYPFQVRAPRQDGFGIALFSRLPLVDSKVIQLDPQADVPVIHARVAVGSDSLDLVGVHLLSPLSPNRFGVRNRQFTALTQMVKQLSENCLVLGDFNATPWSSHVRAFMRTTGLRDGRLGFGIQATWPQSVPAVRIPIDLTLASSSVQIHRRSVGGDIGSDHYPVLAEISVSDR